MILILKKISPSTIVPDIESFIHPALEGGFWKKKGKIESVKIQMIEQLGSDKVEYNALVSVEPDTVGERVIKMLNRKPINGKYINVSEFHFRHRDNERRTSRYSKANDRRNADRRRSSLEIKDVTDQRKTPLVDHSRVGWSTDVTL